MVLIPTDIQSLWGSYVDYKVFMKQFPRPQFRVTKNFLKQWFGYTYNGRILNYIVKVIDGPRPENGYPLYIVMHGGGGAAVNDLRVNDNSWWGVAEEFYYEPVLAQCNAAKEGAIFIAVRGVTSVNLEEGTVQDTYDIHSQPESYVMLQRLIRGWLHSLPLEMWDLELGQDYLDAHKDCTNHTFVDPNRVSLLGFSAGGDGAFQMAARLPDVFNAIVPGGGHPNWVSFANLANLPLHIQCGEIDTDDKAVAGNDRSGVHNRAEEMVRNQFQLDDLRKNVRQQLLGSVPGPLKAKVFSYNFYPHETSIVKGKAHNSWAQPEEQAKDQDVLTSLYLWQDERRMKETDPKASIDGARATMKKNINAAAWVSSPTRLREPLPKFVVWALGTRPTQPDDIRIVGQPKVHAIDKRPEWTPKNLFYWLYLRTPDGNSTALTQTIRAAYDRDSNSVWVDQASTSIGLLINGKMLNLAQKFKVCVGDKVITELGPIQSSEKLRKETLWARGDPSWIFDALVYFEKQGDGWTAKTADTLGEGALKAKL